MLEQHRRHYLEAMGITVWQARGQSAAATAPTGTASVQKPEQPLDAPSAETDAATAIRQWLIWMSASPNPQYTAIVEDLQALCLHALPGSSRPQTVAERPEKLAADTAVLALGLSDNDRDWLTQHGVRHVALPALHDWHNQPDAKQAVWRTLMEGLWLRSSNSNTP